MFYTSFERDEYEELCNWNTILCETNEAALKHLLKLTRKHLCRSLFFDEVTTLLKRDLLTSLV